MEGILKNPEPKVFLQTFADSAVEFRVLFCVDNMDNWLEMRNRVMTGIFRKFKEEGVEIPFPQQDLNFKSFPDGREEEVKKLQGISDFGSKKTEEKNTNCQRGSDKCWKSKLGN